MKRKAPSNEPPRRCELCSLDFTSQSVLDMHLSGSKHSKKLKALDTMKQLQSLGHVQAIDQTSEVFHCHTCNKSLNSALQLHTHYEGTKHKNKVNNLEAKAAAAENGDGQTSLKLGQYLCDICNIIVNSQTQLQQHLESNKHKYRAEGKPIARKKLPKKLGEEAMDDAMIRSNALHGIPPLSATFV